MVVPVTVFVMMVVPADVNMGFSSVALLLWFFLFLHSWNEVLGVIQYTGVRIRAPE